MRRAMRGGSGAEGSGAPARLGREESVPGAASAAFAAAGPPFGWGCLCFCPGRGAARVCPQLPDPADPQQTHVRRAAGNPAFSTALSVREGETPPSSRVPRIPCGFKDQETEPPGAGWGLGHHNKCTCARPRAGIPGRSRRSRAAGRARPLSQLPGGERRAPLAAGGRRERGKGTTGLQAKLPDLHRRAKRESSSER